MADVSKAAITTFTGPESTLFYTGLVLGIATKAFLKRWGVIIPKRGKKFKWWKFSTFAALSVSGHSAKDHSNNQT